MQSNYLVLQGITHPVTSYNLVFIVLSFLASSLHGTLILSSKKMRNSNHGLSNMILSFTLAAQSAHVFMGYFACSLGLPELFRATVIGKADLGPEQQLLRATGILQQSSRFFDMFYWAYSLLIYGLIMQDLRTRVNRPFRVQKLNDTQQLSVTAFFIFLACLVMIIYSMLGREPSRHSMRFFIGILIFFFYLFACLSIFSFFFLMKVLGMGEDSKKKMM